MILVDNKSFRRLKLSHTEAEKLPRWTRSRKCENLESLSEEPSAAKRRPKVRGDLHELMKDYEYFGSTMLESLLSARNVASSGALSFPTRSDEITPSNSARDLS
jgi:hypothetical protein